MKLSLLLACIAMPHTCNASTYVQTKPVFEMNSFPSVKIESLDRMNNNMDDNISTNAKNLAIDFEKAIIAINKNREDIHVGKLLSACETLETTMRDIGFGRGADDIASNVAKIRNIYNKISLDKRDSMPELLQYELQHGITNNAEKNERTPNNSATMGLLWLGRSLNYQQDMFQNMLDTNQEPYEAACHAYENCMKTYLPWPMQRAAALGLRTLKNLQRNTILANIGGFSEECYGYCEDQATRNDLRQVVHCLQPILCRWKEVFSELNLGDI